MDKYVYINTDAFKEAIRRKGFNLREMSRMLDRSDNYITYVGAPSGGGRIEKAFLETEYTASQESKRFYQEGHVTFKTLISWMKAGWKQ